MFWTRINTVLLVLLLLTMLAILGVLATRTSAGPLDPPGPVAPTDGVREPGTPVDALPFTIDQPGRYYLTRNLTGSAASNGITIAANDVTLDLGGFTLTGADAMTGILVSGNRTNLRIQNGSVREWGTGIIASTAIYSVLDGLRVSFNTGDGVRIAGGSTLQNCNVSNNQGTGIVATIAVVRRCVVMENDRSGISAAIWSHIADNRVIRNNFASDPAHAGIKVDGNTNHIDGNSVRLNVVNDVLLTSEAISSAVTNNHACAIDDQSPGGNHVPIGPALQFFDGGGHAEYDFVPEQNYC